MGTNLRTGPRRPCWVAALHLGSGTRKDVLMAGTPSHWGVSTAQVQSQTQDARLKTHVSQSGTGTHLTPQAHERATAKGSHGRARRRDLRISSHQEWLKVKTKAASQGVGVRHALSPHQAGRR